MLTCPTLKLSNNANPGKKHPIFLPHRLSTGGSTSRPAEITSVVSAQSQIKQRCPQCWVHPYSSQSKDLTETIVNLIEIPGVQFRLNKAHGYTCKP